MCEDELAVPFIDPPLHKAGMEYKVTQQTVLPRSQEDGEGDGSRLMDMSFWDAPILSLQQEESMPPAALPLPVTPAAAAAPMSPLPIEPLSRQPTSLSAPCAYEVALSEDSLSDGGRNLLCTGEEDELPDFAQL